MSHDNSRELYEMGSKQTAAPKVETVSLSSGAIVRGVFSEADSVLILTLEHDYPDLDTDAIFSRDGNEYGIVKRDGRVLTCEA